MTSTEKNEFTSIVTLTKNELELVKQQRCHLYVLYNNEYFETLVLKLLIDVNDKFIGSKTQATVKNVILKIEQYIVKNNQLISIKDYLS